MKAYAESPIFSNTPNPDGSPVVVEVNGSKPGRKYRVDLTNGRCSCPAWIYQKGGRRQPCKHLRALGYVEIDHGQHEVQVSEPKQAEMFEQMEDQL